MRRLLPACLAIAALSAIGVDAIAQEDGVFVDPESPAGKEYAIPFDEARREAGGGSGGAPGTAAPFGEGIERDDDAAPDGGQSGGGGDGRRDAGGGDAGGGQPSSPRSPSGSPGVAASLDQGGPSAALLTGGIALGVLLVGGAVGFLVRRTNS